MKTVRLCRHRCNLVLIFCVWTISTIAGSLPLGTLLNSPPPTEIIYKYFGTQDLKLFCFQPSGERHVLRPAAVWIHGGGWVGGTCESFFPMARYTASRGAASFLVQYRLVNTNGTVTVSNCVADCKSAVRYLRSHAEELGIDPHRIAVIGESAGGHLAACVGVLDGFDDPTDDFKTSARPDALVLYNPLTKFEGSNFEKLFAGATEKTNLMHALSPLLHVRKNLPPTICIHGLADSVVSPDDSRQFADAMQIAGNRCDLVLLPETPHAFLIPNYKCSEQTIVNSLLIADKFLTSLGWFSGKPNLVASDPPSWTAKWPPAKK
jgi:acetyl esterase